MVRLNETKKVKKIMLKKRKKCNNYPYAVVDEIIVLCKENEETKRISMKRVKKRNAYIFFLLKNDT